MASPQKYELVKINQGENHDEKTPVISIYLSNDSGSTPAGVLPGEVIEYLKSYENWCYIEEESHTISPWSLNEEEISNLYMQYPWLNVDDQIQFLASDDEEIVLGDDLWGLKEIKKTPDA